MIESIVFIGIYFMIFFIFGTIQKNNSIVDQAWGIGFVLVAFFNLLRLETFQLTHLLVVGLISLWGLRLFFHIFKRNHKKAEDFRYAKWREEWGKWVVPRAFLQVYMLQGLFMWVIALPAIILLNTVNDINSSILWLIGVIVWLWGYYFEVVGDAQLKKYKSNPANKGKIMTQGLWQYTRHPNYYGEATMWWGIWLLCISSGVGLWTVVGPLTITFLLLFVSGVPMLEKAMANREGFAEYAARTNRFFPWFPKKGVKS